LLLCLVVLSMATACCAVRCTGTSDRIQLTVSLTNQIMHKIYKILLTSTFPSKKVCCRVLFQKLSLSPTVQISRASWQLFFMTQGLCSGLHLCHQAKHHQLLDSYYDSTRLYTPKLTWNSSLVASSSGGKTIEPATTFHGNCCSLLPSPLNTDDVPEVRQTHSLTSPVEPSADAAAKISACNVQQPDLAQLKAGPRECRLLEC